MIRKSVLIIAFLVLVCVVPAAFAQFGDDTPSKLGIRVMNFMPLGDIPSNLKSNWIGIGLDWNLKQDEDGKPLKYVTLGFMSSGGDVRKGSETFITETKLHRTPISDSRAHYTGYGWGIYKLGIEQAGSFMSAGSSESALRPGIHVLYGQEFKQTFFAEIRLDLMPNFISSQWGGIYLNIGTRVSL